MLKTIEFTVLGTGQFPFDMLRYDQCWPKTESHDSVNLGLTAQRDKLGVRTVTLVKVVERLSEFPASERWKSFGWTVVKVNGRKTLQ